MVPNALTTYKFMWWKIIEMKRFCTIAILIMTLALAVRADDENIRFQALRIAHAGGGLGKTSYTNSYQALTVDIDNGFKYFEIDFTFTKDDQLVCLHDWKHNF